MRRIIAAVAVLAVVLVLGAWNPPSADARNHHHGGGIQIWIGPAYPPPVVVYGPPPVYYAPGYYYVVPPPPPVQYWVQDQWLWSCMPFYPCGWLVIPGHWEYR